MDARPARRRAGALTRVAVIAALLVGAVGGPAAAGALVMPRAIEFVSYPAVGANDGAWGGVVSGNGRYVAFESSSAFHESDTDDGVMDVYRRDLTTNEILLVSIPGDAAQVAQTGCRDPRISDDGRYVSFITRASLDVEDVNGMPDIYVWDATDGSYTWVDLRGAWALWGYDLSYQLSGDGSTVVFEAYEDLVLEDDISPVDIYAIDVASGALTWVSSAPLADDGYGSRLPAVSDDGRYVAFLTGKAYVESDTNGSDSALGTDVYVRDLDAAEPTFALVPLRDHMSGSTQSSNFTNLEISGDGSTVVFEAQGAYGSWGFACPEDTQSNKDVYAYNLATDSFMWVSGGAQDREDYGSRNPQVSADGRYISFFTGKVFVSEDTATRSDIYLYDTVEDRHLLLNPGRSIGDGDADDFRMSDDAKKIVWTSYDPLVSEDENGEDDVYALSLPVPVDDSFTADEDTILAQTVIINDGVSTDLATVEVVNAPSHGSVNMASNGTFVYTPAANYNGADSFTYRVTDIFGEWPALGTVSITVNPVNDAPVAVNDVYSVLTGTTLNGSSVLANDVDVESNPLTAVLVSGPTKGSLSLNANGTFTYTPNAGFSGTDSFTYKANDGSADSAPASVTITVYGASVPIHRFYNTRTGTHFYTASDSERALVISKWPTIFQYEGVAYSVNAGLDTTSLHRFYNVWNGSHFYTASEQEKAIVQMLWPHTYRYEGAAYGVSLYDGPGKMPIYRFYNLRNGSHFYTASAAERDDVIAKYPLVYAYEGIAYFVAAPH